MFCSIAVLYEDQPEARKELRLFFMLGIEK
jgi:hypothetical protein